MPNEPLAESSVWLDIVALWTCRRADGTDCSWYHGSWQHLRLLNLVSSPAWHAEFLTTSLRSGVDAGAGARILVSGCADFSLYAHVLEALGPAVQVDVLDRCRTPLLANLWYARRIGVAPPSVLCADATTHRPEQAYDAVVSDAFLPRFPPDQLRSLLRAWRVSLKPGGSAVTTVRLHELGSAESASPDAVAARWVEVATQAAAWWPSVSVLPTSELAHRVEEFARRQERNAIHEVAEIERLFAEAGFSDVDVELADLSGKRFARIRAH